MIRFNRFSSAAALVTAGMVAAGIGGAAPSRAQTVPPHVPGRILVQFKPTATAEQVRSLVASANAQIQGEIPKTGVKVLKLSANANDMAVMRAFAQRPEVRFAELDAILRPAQSSVTPNDPYFASEWHLKKIGAQTAWGTTTGSSAVIVAVLDTGVDGTHPDLSPKMVPGWNFFNNTSDTTDAYGHGTMVAGTVAASSNNGAGVASLAWGCKIMPIRVTDAAGNSSISAMASGLTWAADHGARVANISFSATSVYSTVSTAAQYFQAQGGVVTTSAGNEATVLAYASNPYELTICATDANDAVCSWSNTGTPIDISAPGTTIYAPFKGGGYGTCTGTSFSAPIVAGVAALMISANPNLTGSQLRSLLVQAVDDLGVAGWDPLYGYGRINAAKAITLAMSAGGVDSTAPTISITSPSAGASVAGTVSVQTVASDNVGVSSVGFYVDDVLKATDNASPYAFAWDSTTVGNGGHTLKVIATDSAGNSGAATAVITVSNPVNQAPTVANPALAASNPVLSTTVGLNVLGADDGGEANLTYTWSATGPSAVTFSANGANSAKNTTVTFSTAGSYSFTVSIRDASGLAAPSSVSVTVNQIATSMTVSPGSASVSANGSQQFAGSVKDQFETLLAVQPSLTWSVSGGGTIGASGLFTAGSAAGGPFTVTATVAGVTSSASISVTSPRDTTAPSVSIASPLNGSKVSGTVTVTATATDNAGVTKVELWVDGKLSSTDSALPYAFSVNTKGWKTGSTHKFSCKAYDAAGNLGTSATVSVSK